MEKLNTPVHMQDDLDRVPALNKVCFSNSVQSMRVGSSHNGHNY